MLNQRKKTEFLLNGFLHIKEAFNPVVAHRCAEFVLEQIDDPELDIDRETGYAHIKENFSDDPFSTLWSEKLESCVDSLLGKNNYQAITEWGWFPISFPEHAPKEKVAPEEGGILTANRSNGLTTRNTLLSVCVCSPILTLGVAELLSNRLRTNDWCATRKSRK